ncbi:MAG: hypothetical protein D6689_17585 [Deltaproteobacteria bacterium]|nr:MAG: hypothetical protein D6689_17585 [Deltaproteobacteria bacterium]
MIAVAMGLRRPRPIVVCWGELLWDLLPDGPRLGGAPANAAYHAAVLGDRAILVSRVGRDPLGDAAIAALARAGVDVDCIQRDDLPTGQVDVALDDGEPRFAVRAPAAWDRIAVDAAVRRALARADAFVFGTLGRRTAAATAALWRALDALPAGCLRACDANLRPPFDDLTAARQCVARADVVKVDAAEAARLGIVGPLPGKVVAITRGGATATLWANGRRHDAVPPRIDPSRGDRIGAGDAYTAALVHNLLRGRPPAAAHARAVAYAAHVAALPGGMPPMPPEAVAAAR